MKDPQKTVKYLIVPLALLVITFQQSFAQEQSLESQFNKLMEYSTYERYKVVPITEMNGFWANINDTLSVRNSAVGELKTRIQELEVELDTINRELNVTQKKLASSLLVNDQIEFVGISFNKTAYHVMVWSIMVVLLVLGSLGYMMYLSSNKTTTKAKKESEGLRAELEDFKDKARETQVRLKRELQTAVNSIEEMRRGGARR